MSGELDRVIGDCGLYQDGRRVPGRLTLTEVRAAAARSGNFVWVGLQQARPAQVVAVAEHFRLPRLAVEDAVRAHQRPKLEVYDGVLFVILKPVRYVDHEEVVEVGQIALFISTHFVVSVRHGESDVLRRVRAELDAGPGESAAVQEWQSAGEGTQVGGNADTDGSADAWEGPVRVLYRAADLVVDGYQDALDLINEDIDQIESRVFDSADGQDHSERIYKLKREIAEFRRAVVPLQAPLARLAAGQVPGSNGRSSPYFRDVQDHLLRVSDAIESHDRLLSDVLQANMTRVATLQNQIALRQNEDMRRISAWAAIGLVPTAIAGIYGMNFDNMPELHWVYGYFMVVTVIAAACTTLYVLFRRNNWL